MILTEAVLIAVVTAVGGGAFSMGNKLMDKKIAEADFKLDTLQKEIERLNSEIDAHKETIANMKESVENENDSLKQELKDIRDELHAAENDTDKYRKLYWNAYENLRQISIFIWKTLESTGMSLEELEQVRAEINKLVDPHSEV